MYQKLYYKTKIKPFVDAAYEEYLTTCRSSEELEEGTGKKKDRIYFMNLITQEMYEKESDEVKAEVEKTREKRKQQANDDTICEDPEKLQK